MTTMTTDTTDDTAGDVLDVSVIPGRERLFASRSLSSADVWDALDENDRPEGMPYHVYARERAVWLSVADRVQAIDPDRVGLRPIEKSAGAFLSCPIVAAAVWLGFLPPTGGLLLGLLFYAYGVQVLAREIRTHQEALRRALDLPIGPARVFWLGCLAPNVGLAMAIVLSDLDPGMIALSAGFGMAWLGLVWRFALRRARDHLDRTEIVPRLYAKAVETMRLEEETRETEEKRAQAARLVEASGEGPSRPIPVFVVRSETTARQ